MPDAGEDPVKNEHLPEVGNETGRHPANQNAQARQRKQDARPPPIQQDAQQRGGQGANQPRQRKNGRRIGCAAVKRLPQRIEKHRLAVLGAALNRQVAQRQHENNPAVMQPGTRLSQLQHRRNSARRPPAACSIVCAIIRRLYTPAPSSGADFLCRWLRAWMPPCAGIRP